MAITRTTIMNLSTDADYRRGQDIFLVDKRILNFEMDINPFTDNTTVTAAVSESDGTSCEVEVAIDEDTSDILGGSCTCADFYKADKLCAHCVAVLLKYISRRNIMASTATSSRSPLVIHEHRLGQTMIEAYVKRDTLTHSVQHINGLIELEPILHQEYSKLSVEFRIGTQKKYVIKDLLDFARLIREHEFFEYGKNLKFYHERAAFSEKSQPILDFIMQRVQEYEYHFQYVQDNAYSFRTIKALRYLPLSPAAIDRFLSLMVTDTIQFQLQNQKLYPQVVEGDPELILNVSSKGPAGYALSLESCHFISGEKEFWVLKDNLLYRCTPEFAKDMSIFLKEMNRQKTDMLLLSEKQMTPFCGSVLKSLSHHTDIQTDNVDLTSFMPPEVHFSLYLDTPEMNVVSCTAYAHYDAEQISLTTPITARDGYRDAAREQSVLNAIRSYFNDASEEYIGQGDFIIADDDQAIFLFLEQGLPYFYQLGEVFISGDMKKLRIVSAPKASVGVSLAGDLLELDIQSGDLPYEELAGILDSYRRRKKFYRLKSGEFLRLENNSLSVLSELADGLLLSGKDIQDGKITLPIYRSAYVDAILTNHNGDVQTHRDRYFKSLIRDLKSVEDSDYEVPEHIKPLLRDYQKTGYRWLRTITQLGFGGILADDMGLGKTLQIITLLSSQHEDSRPSLIVCPSSLVYNWDSEIERFAPELKVLLITGSAAERIEKIKTYSDYDILITSYDMLKRDIEQYQDISFHYEVIDEAQYIKNHRTQAARAVCEIHSATRFALTGTPIENRLSELWSIFEYLMPGFLYSYSHFRQELEQPIIEDKDPIASNRLRQLVKPFIMRRLKTDVLTELPEKLENAVYAQMDPEQQKLYDANALLLQRSLNTQSEDSFRSNKIQILAELTKLRQLCCDPSLVYDNYRGDSAKLDTCIQLVQNAISGGHKVLLFSQFTSMLDIIERRLHSEKILYYRLDGSTKSEERVRLVNNFNQNAIPVFLISLKAGGTGLNLTGADIVIHYDPWWNAAAQNQATDRAHRIGQTKTVTVYKLIARHTIEEKILKLQESKKALADEIISGEGITASALTKEELLNILEY